MRFLIYLVILACLPCQSFSQEKDKKDRPRIFQGGLIKRFENLQKKMQKDREDRQKAKEEERKEKDRLRDDKRKSELERIREEIERRLDPFAPKRNPEQPKAPARNPNPTARSLTDAPLATDAPKVNLGLEVRPSGITSSGLIVDKVLRNGPAEKAGVKVKDRITAVGGSPIKRMDDLVLIMGAFEPGDRTELEVIRKGKKETFLVDFPGSENKKPLALNSPRGSTEELPLPGSNSSSRRNQGDSGLPPVLPRLDNSVANSRRPETMRTGIGVTAVGVDPVLFEQKKLSVRQGAFLEVIGKESAAEKAGLKPGDVVIALDGRKIDSALSMAELIRTYQPGEKAQILYYRENRLKRAEIEMESVPASKLDPLTAGNLAPTRDLNANPDRLGQKPSDKRNSILGDLGEEFPRLKKVEDLIGRFTPKDGNEAGSRSANGAREAELENEVQSLRNRLRGQDRQIKDLNEKLSLIEKLLSERQAEKKSPEKK